MPAVTVRSWPKGLPMASTHSPTSTALESPRFTKGTLLGVDLQQGQVGLGVGADDPGGELRLVDGQDLHLDGVLDHVVVGQDVAVGRDEKSRTLTGTPFLALRSVEELVKEIVAEPGTPLHDRLGDHFDHRRLDFADNGDEVVGNDRRATDSARATAGRMTGSLLTVFCKKPKLKAKNIAPARKLVPATIPIFFMESSLS